MNNKMLVLVIFVCSLVFNSCKKDYESGSYKTPTVEKKVSSIEIVVKDREPLERISYNYLFSYDSSGRICSVKTNSDDFEIVYIDDKLTQVGTYSVDLNDLGNIGICKKLFYDSPIYVYYNDRKLSQIRDYRDNGEYDSPHFVYGAVTSWDKNNISFLHNNDDKTEFQYSNFKNREAINIDLNALFYPNLSFDLIDGFHFNIMQMFGLLGERSENYVNRSHLEKKYATYNTTTHEVKRYSYSCKKQMVFKFDEDGYPSYITSYIDTRLDELSKDNKLINIVEDKSTLVKYVIKYLE